MNKITAVFSVLLIAANLLLPAQIVTYRSCCYDENGKLSVDTGCGHSNSAPVVREHRTCCDPIVHQLRQSGPSPVVNSSTVAHVSPDWAAPAVLIPARLLDVDTSVVVSARYDTGPPQSHDVLSLHSRLNL